MEKQNQSLLFAAFRNGEEKGLDYFYRQLYQPLCFFARQYVRDMTTAEDVVTEVFLKVWEKRETIHDATGLKAYLYRSVYNGCMNELRRMLRQAQHDREVLRQASAGGRTGQSDSDENLYMTNVIQAETLQQLYAGIDALPAECKKIFNKLYVEGKSVKEVAAELSLAVSTVKAQKARGLKILRMRLGDSLVVATMVWGLGQFFEKFL